MNLFIMRFFQQQRWINFHFLLGIVKFFSYISIVGEGMVPSRFSLFKFIIMKSTIAVITTSQLRKLSKSLDSDASHSNGGRSDDYYYYVSSKQRGSKIEDYDIGEITISISPSAASGFPKLPIEDQKRQLLWLIGARKCEISWRFE